MVKILEVYADFLPKRGGVEMYILDLSSALLKRGHAPIVLVWEPSKPTSEVIEGITVQRFHMPSLFTTLRYPQIAYLSAHILLNSIRHDIQLIHAHDYIPGLAAALAGKFLRIPVTVTFHLPIYRTSWRARKKSSPSYLIEHLLQKIFINKVNTAICVSKFTYNESLKLGFPKDKLKVIYNWVRQPLISATKNENEVLKKYNLSQTRFALSVGRLDEKQKAFSLLIRSFRLLADRGLDIDLVIVGEGPAEVMYKRLIDALGLQSRIRLFGRIQDEDLVCLYKNCSFFVLSSFFEALPLVVLEAMSFGKPIVATNVGGLSEIINNGHNGLLLETNSESIALGIERLLSSPEMMRTFAEAAKETVNIKFSKHNCEEVIRLLETLPKSAITKP
jgi:glycosyltransferase involved in cell wall biosynthesis